MKIILLICFSIFVFNAFSQDVKSVKIFNEFYNANSVIKVEKNRYIIAGSARSKNHRSKKNHGEKDFWVAKITHKGRVIWSRQYGGSNTDFANSILQTSDGGYIVAGQTFSNDGDVSDWNGQMDIWIVKLTKKGEIVWSKTLGGSKYDDFTSIQQTKDKGFILAGISCSNDNGSIIRFSKPGCWIVKFTASGKVQFATTFGDKDISQITSLHQIEDGGYIAAGLGTNLGRICHDPHISDYYITKLSPSGDIIWSKKEEWFFEVANTILQIDDGGYILLGHKYRYDNSEDKRSYKYLLIKLSATGEKVYSKFLEDSYAGDYIYFTQQTLDGGLIIAGSSTSDNEAENNKKDKHDIWLMKLSETAEIDWVSSISKPEYNRIYSLRQASDGGYIIIRGIKSEGYNKQDSLLVNKLLPTGETNWSRFLYSNGYRNEYVFAPNADGGCIVINNSTSMNGKGKKVLDIRISKIDSKN